MKGSAPSVERIDEALALRVAALSRGSQRQLKMMLQALIADVETPEAEDVEAGAGTRSGAHPREKRATLEDVVTGKADLREHLQAYPELAEELDGMAEVIDLLREAGERRRRRGEQILREEILGEKPKPAAAEDEDSD